MFGPNYPIEIAFATPDCSPGLYNKIQDLTKLLSDILKKYYSPVFDNIEIKLYFNQTFSNEIYLPLKANIDVLNNDNDLFMRALNLAKAAEARVSKPTKTASPAPAPLSVSASVASAPTSVVGASGWSDFDTYSPSGYSGFIRTIMRELSVADICELEARIDEMIVYCTNEMTSAKKSGDKRREKYYSNYRSALRKYKEFMDSKKIAP